MYHSTPYNYTNDFTKLCAFGSDLIICEEPDIHDAQHQSQMPRMLQQQYHGEPNAYDAQHLAQMPHMHNRQQYHGSSVSRTGSEYLSGDYGPLYLIGNNLNNNSSFPTVEIEVYEVTRELNDNEFIRKSNKDQILFNIETFMTNEPFHSWIINALNSQISSDIHCIDFTSKLLYHGTKDGFNPLDFHSKCDGISNTVCMIEDNNGEILGGYTNLPWTSPPMLEEIESPNSFIFKFCNVIGGVTSKQVKRDSNRLTHSSSMLFSFDGLSVLNDGIFNSTMTEGGSENNNAREILVYQIFPFTINIPLSCNEATEQMKLIIKQTEDIAVQLLELDKTSQLAEEKLYSELLWIENHTAPISQRNITTGLQADWDTLYRASLDMLPLSNGLNFSNCKSNTLEEIRKIMIRLSIPINVRKECNEGDHSVNDHYDVSLEEITTISPVIVSNIPTTTTSAESFPIPTSTPPTHATVAAINYSELSLDHPVVISFNVGGDIIAVLRSTLLFQAPQSTFAANFSGRWSLQEEELDEFGNILLVRKKNYSNII